jgi:hypothetical protein
MKFGKLLYFMIFLIILTLLPQPVFAGTGKVVDGTPKYVNLNLYYNYTPTDLYVMRNAFQEASRLLFNSTNGQMRLGTVRVSTNSAFQDSADVWVNSGASGAYTNLAGLGTSGLHLTLFENRHKWTNEDGPLGTERGQFGITHEFGHYAFSVYDEYDTGSFPGACCVSTTSTIACIMDGGTTQHPNHHRTEWCTPAGGGLTTSHVTTPDTPQQHINGESCWETIRDYCNSEYGITMTIPTTVNTSDPAGLPPIGWSIIGDHLRYVITLDRSYSMSVDNKETLAKQAAVLFTNLCYKDVGESLGVVSFSNTAVANFPIQEVTTTPDTKALAITAINGIALENMTAMGDGLRTSLNQITGGGTVPVDTSAVEAVVLLSDGVHNYGTESPSAVLPDLISSGVRVFTIGLGSASHPTYPLDEGTLLDISNQTGASYRHAPDAIELSSIYTDYSAEIRGMSTSPEASGELGSEGTGEHEVLVDDFTIEETFVLHWPFGANAFELHLRDPDGNVFTPTSTGGMEYAEKEFHRFYRVEKPKPGIWKMLVMRKKGGGRGCLFNKPKINKERLQYTTQAIAKAPGLSCRVAPKQAFYKPGQDAIIRAFVVAGGTPVAKVRVSGMIRMPDGKNVDVVLYDDGDWKQHGDDKANDGMYSMRFNDTQQVGTYQVKLIIDNKEGITATPDEIDPNFKPQSVNKFIRSAKTTFSVGRQIVKPPDNEKPQ